MNRLLSITFITIILLNFAQAGQRAKKEAERRRREAAVLTPKQQEKKDREDAINREHNLAPKEIRDSYPGTFGSCGTEEDHDNFDIYINVIKSAQHAGIEIPHAPADISVLTLENCKSGIAGENWVKFTYETAEANCAFVIAVGYKGLILQSNNYFLDIEKTNTINKVHELSHCTPKEAEVSKIVTDNTVDINEELENEIIREELAGMQNEIINKAGTQEEDIIVVEEDTKVVVDEQVPPTHEDKTTTPHHETSHVEKQPATHHDETSQVQKEPVVEVIPPTYGPAGKFVPAHNRLDGQNPTGRAAPSLVEDQEDMGDAMTHLFKEPLVGGWSTCNENEYDLANQVFSLLISQQKIHGVTIYVENVSRCYHQLVNGMNYNMEISVNRKLCQLSFHKEIRGELSLLNGAPSLGAPLCTDVFKTPNAAA